NSALVTGGTSGLGLGTARALAKAGARVTILDLPSSAGAEIAAEIGGVFVAADVTDTAQVEAALDAAEAQGPLRALVHCAGRGARPGDEADPGVHHRPRAVRHTVAGPVAGGGQDLTRQVGAAPQPPRDAGRVREARAAHRRQPHAQRRDDQARRRDPDGTAVS